MISASDILKVLDKIPEWIGLKRLLARVDALENRVAELETAGSKRRPFDACPLCGAELQTISTRPDPLFGDLGVEQRSVKCSACSYAGTRQIDPGRRR